MKAVEEQPKLDSGTDDVISAEDAREDQSSTVKKPPRWQDVFGSGLGRISYEYFNWRRVSRLMWKPISCQSMYDCHFTIGAWRKQATGRPFMSEARLQICLKTSVCSNEHSTFVHQAHGSWLMQLCQLHTAGLQGTWNDLQSILLLNLAIVLAGGIIKTSFVDILAGTADSAPQSRIWQNLYQVVITSLA